MPTNALAPPVRNAMLRPYTPSWREQIEAYLMGDARPSPERRQFAQGLTSLLGFVPGVGNVLQGQEAARAGDSKGVAMAMLPIPGAARAGAVAKAAEREAPHIIAYHGSPHSFDKFDISKIGGGEGAQAYGHGLYFADSENVAKSYRDALKKGYFNNILNIEGNDFASDMGNYYLRNAVEKAVPNPTEGFASGKETFDFYNKQMSDAVYRALLKAEHGADVHSTASDAIGSVLEKHKPFEYDAAGADEVRRALLGYIQNNVTSRPNGSMYQVRINADPEHFLDWDKPLSEQSPVVQERLLQTGWSPEHMKSNVLDGGYVAPTTPYGSEKYAQAGIPGIKYLDQGSRAAGEGSRNYVVFDDKIIEIMKKYGLVGPIGAGIAAKILERQEQRQEM